MWLLINFNDYQDNKILVNKYLFAANFFAVLSFIKK